MGYVYLVQPVVLVGTNRYKIGRSSQSNFNRLKAYLKGTRNLCIVDCDDDKYIEKNLIEHFNSKFKLIGGNEYFEGNELDMIYEFNQIVYETKTELKKRPETTWLKRFAYKG